MAELQRVFWDAGHGGKDPGAVKYVTEATVAKKVVKYGGAFMKENYECEVYIDMTDGSTHQIAARANAWEADLFISVHFNAGGGDGWEGLVYSIASIKLGQTFEKHVKAIGQNSRGVKFRPELNVLRLTKMPAILNEAAFVDNKQDIKDWDEDHELKKMGEALAKAAAEYLGLKKKSSGPKYETITDLNFRKAPNLESVVLGLIPKGTKLTGTPEGSWLKTKFEGKTGYVRIKGQKTYCKKV